MPEEASDGRGGDVRGNLRQKKTSAMPEGAVEFLIHVHAGLWRLSRDGREIGTYSHAERAVHEAAVLARELQETGQPASVRLQAEGRTLVIDTGPQGRSAPPGAEEARSSMDGQ